MHDIRKQVYLDRVSRVHNSLMEIVNKLEIISDALGKDVDQELSKVGVKLSTNGHGYDKNKWSNFANTIQRLKVIAKEFGG